MKKLLLFTIILSTFACKEQKKETAQADTLKVVAEKPQIKLYVFNGGTVQVNQLNLFSQDTTYTGLSKEFADAFYVIRHPKGDLMWDAGLPESLVGMEEPYTDPSGAFTVSRKDSVLNQLASIGMSVDDIDYLSMSHTHFDHVGHANAFSGSTWLVQELEYDFVTSKKVQESNPEMYNSIKGLTNIKKIKGDYDVFGDGAVVMKFMPGHTPGHQVLFLDLPEHGPLLLSGDLYHFSENREFRRIPIFNSDVAQTQASMDAFEAFALEKNAKVYLQHSKEDFDKFPRVPNYLK
ncbi:N-acyl homoserine lactonase family protein [Flagellimonas allohymeniacidonis]|uniref:N-acyl homoserine lactonase family protein n=1 Tax=Flagellimonas allohymeniacidonis TaxID=2517819 RepID=A0A4Q8QAV8_9FLAO|nr:N-acyl homoserine lactonase family protein [Allomuricauda hymeniacidonis]TAI47455.1 N-acyl homoserine lactonase family protein [Allomuricauda hymeniacidonis]